MGNKINTSIANMPDFLIKKYQDKLIETPKSKLFVPLSNLLRRNGRLEEALKVSKRGAKLHPKYISGIVMLAMAHYETGHIEEAEQEFKRAEVISRENILIHKMLYKIYKKQDNEKAAVKELKKILKICPKDLKTKILLEKSNYNNKQNNKNFIENLDSIDIEVKCNFGDVKNNNTIKALESWLDNIMTLKLKKNQPVSNKLSITS